jgi:hypothetical protein
MRAIIRGACRGRARERARVRIRQAPASIAGHASVEIPYKEAEQTEHSPINFSHFNLGTAICITACPVAGRCCAVGTDRPRTHPLSPMQ